MKAIRFWLIFTLLCLCSFLVATRINHGTDARPFAVAQSWANQFHSWLKSEAEPRSPESAQPAASIHHQQTLSVLDHTHNDSAVCQLPQTKDRTDVQPDLIYKWEDEEGQTHMADTRPPGVIASVLDIGLNKRDFTYEIIEDGVSLPIDFEGQLAAGSKRMYDTWHFFLGEEKLRQSHITLLMVGSADRFNAYRGNTSPNAKPISGFYSMSKNKAVVKFKPQRIEQTLATTFHEISHLITASHLGPTPPWLTEGLAEYFETMKVKGQVGVIYPNQAHIKLLQDTSIPRLSGYLAIERPEWHEEDRNRNYAIAWSLVHFLMQDSPGIDALKSVIQEAQANFCKPFSAKDALAKAYPGGLQQLEINWRRWLAADNFQVLQT